MAHDSRMALPHISVSPDAPGIETPEADAAEQRRAAWDYTDDPADAPPDLYDGAPPFASGEAEPADVLDQSREVALDDEQR